MQNALFLINTMTLDIEFHQDVMCIKQKEMHCISSSKYCHDISIHNRVTNKSLLSLLCQWCCNIAYTRPSLKIEHNRLLIESDWSGWLTIMLGITICVKSLGSFHCRKNRRLFEQSRKGLDSALHFAVREFVQTSSLSGEDKRHNFFRSSPGGAQKAFAVLFS